MLLAVVVALWAAAAAAGRAAAGRAGSGLYAEYSAAAPQYEYDAPRAPAAPQPAPPRARTTLLDDYQDDTPLDDTQHFVYKVQDKGQGLRRSANSELDVEYVDTWEKPVNSYRNHRKSKENDDESLRERLYANEHYPKHQAHEDRVENPPIDHDEAEGGYVAVSGEPAAAAARYRLAGAGRIVRRKPRDKAMRALPDYRPGFGGAPPPPRGDDELPAPTPLPAPPPSPRHPDYDEYYDMKRLNQNRDKLSYMRPNVLENAAREAGELRPLPGPFPVSAEAADIRPYSSLKRPIGLNKRPKPALLPVQTESTLITNTSSADSKADVDKTVLDQPTNSSELSLAEKSRLSIMKKALRKESVRNETSTKPPVLLRVTERLHTAVVVEPGEARLSPRMRAAADESPDRLQRARRLMRRKLVEGARDMADLTSNWDDVVCDYIDLSLISAAHTFQISLFTLASNVAINCIGISVVLN